MKKVEFKNSQIPLHYQIADYMIIMLKRGDLKADEKIPSEEELREGFSVSRTTIRRALDHLLHKGLVYKLQGKGTYWTESAHDLGQEKLSGINRQIFDLNRVTTVKVLSKKIKPATQDIIKFFSQKENETIVFKRLRFSDKEPMSYTINYLPIKYGEIIEKAHLAKMTMLETLESVCGIELGRIEHEVEITRANSEVSDNLKIAALDPVLTVKTLVFDTENNPIEVVWTYFVENKYKFRVVFNE